MRSTLLFVAVLLACTPGHAYATVPSGAPILNGDFASLFRAPATLADRSVRANHPSPQSIASAHHHTVTLLATPQAPIQALPDKTLQSATLLLHDPNAP